MIQKNLKQQSPSASSDGGSHRDPQNTVTSVKTDVSTLRSKEDCVMPQTRHAQTNKSKSNTSPTPALTIRTQDTLPKQWSMKDKSASILLSGNYLRASNTGICSCSVRSDRPIPDTCSEFYFEVKIVKTLADLQIGLSERDSDVNRHLAYFPNSYGYLSDDGMKGNNSKCKDYGPKFSNNDIIGCGVVDGQCFFTKNGVFLGTAFEGVPPNLCPTARLGGRDVVTANFGQSSYQYDLDWDALRGHLLPKALPMPSQWSKCQSTWN